MPDLHFGWNELGIDDVFTEQDECVPWSRNVIFGPLRSRPSALSHVVASDVFLSLFGRGIFCHLQ